MKMTNTVCCPLGVSFELSSCHSFLEGICIILCFLINTPPDIARLSGYAVKWSAIISDGRSSVTIMEIIADHWTLEDVGKSLIGMMSEYSVVTIAPHGDMKTWKSKAP